MFKHNFINCINFTILTSTNKIVQTDKDRKENNTKPRNILRHDTFGAKHQSLTGTVPNLLANKVAVQI